MYLRKMLKYKPDIVTRFEYYKKQEKKKSIRNILQNTCVRPGRSLFGSPGSEYAINNTGLYWHWKMLFYFTIIIFWEHMCSKSDRKISILEDIGYSLLNGFINGR